MPWSRFRNTTDSRINEAWLINNAEGEFKWRSCCITLNVQLFGIKRCAKHAFAVRCDNTIRLFQASPNGLFWFTVITKRCDQYGILDESLMQVQKSALIN